MSELARILMAVDNLEKKCLNRRERSALQYPMSAVNLEDPKNFNMFNKRATYAKAQLQFIEQYLKDFSHIIKDIKEKKGTLMEEMNKKKSNHEVI